MATTTKIVRTGGVSFLGLLGIAFIVLKLCGVINWSWWLVLLPLYIPPIIFLIIFLVLVLLVARYK